MSEYDLESRASANADRSGAEGWPFATTLVVNMEPAYAILLATVLLREQRELALYP